MVSNSKMGTHFLYGTGNSANRNDAVAPPVFGLEPLFNPLAVGWFVSLGIVDSLDGKAGGALAKVGKKGGKRIAPTLADGNTPTSIVLKLCGRGAIATALHVKPTRIGKGGLALFGLCHPVGCMSLLADATTGLCPPVNKVPDAGDFGFSTVALADGLLGIRRKLNDLELAETATDKGFVSGHDDDLSIVVSSDRPQHTLRPVASSEYLTSN